MDKDRFKIFSYYIGIGLGIILVIAFLTSQILMPLFFGKARTIKVPNLTDISYTRASAILINNKLHAVVKDSTYSDKIKSGYIISQKPDPGELLKPDGTVYLVLSMGSKFVKVPKLVGLNVQAAWILLKNNGLKFSVVDSIYSDIYPPNTVIQSSPAIGERVEHNSKIKLYISKGQPEYVDTLDIDPDYIY